MGEIDGRDQSEQHHSTQDELEERGRQQRLAALQSLAAQVNLTNPAGPAARSQSATATTSSRPRGSIPARTRLLVAGLIAVVVLAAGGVAAYQLTHRTTRAVVPPIPTALTIDLTKDGLNCPGAMAWSPDGMRLAVMAQTGDCTRQSMTNVNVLALYDTRTGKLMQRFKPDDLLAKQGVEGRAYGAVWSADGTTLALGAVTYPTANGPFSQGLLLISVQQGTARLIQGPSYEPDKEPPQLTWDVANARLAAMSDPVLPMALTYRWTPDGRLAADAPMTTGTTQAFSPSPDSFSRWHSGTLEHIDDDHGNGNLAQVPPPVTWYLASAIPSWSPDGRYFTTLTLTTRLTADGKSARPITTGPCGGNWNVIAAVTDVCKQVGVAPLDAGLAAALAAAQAGHELTDSTGATYGTVWSNVSVDWRPDGKVLAAIYPADGFEDQSSTVTTVKVTLLDTQTGQPLTTLIAKRRFTNGSASTMGVPYTAWSPNGQQLAFEDYFSSRITIWGAESLSALPK